MLNLGFQPEDGTQGTATASDWPQQLIAEGVSVDPDRREPEPHQARHLQAQRRLLPFEAGKGGGGAAVGQGSSQLYAALPEQGSPGGLRTRPARQRSSWWKQCEGSALREDSDLGAGRGDGE